MDDPIEKELRTLHAKAYADQAVRREEFFAAVGDAYQNPDQAIENMQWALGRWGVPRTVEIIEQEPHRIGAPRGTWYTRDGWTLGAGQRSAIAGEAIARLPGLAEAMIKAELAERHARNALDSYCRSRGREPERAPFGPASLGAAQVPPHRVDDPDKRSAAPPHETARERDPQPTPEWWDVDKRQRTLEEGPRHQIGRDRER